MIRILYLHGLPAASRAQQQSWLDELPAPFRARLQRQQRPQRLLQSLTGLQLLQLAARRQGIESFSLAGLQTTGQGKPWCDALPGFSISHSAELVACALSTEGPVGLDVEQVRPIEPTRFARTFNPDEQAWIGDSRTRFFELWTRKEAVIKVSGEHGIAQMRQVELDGGRARLHGRELHLMALDLHPDYRAAIATATAPEKVETEQACFTDNTWSSGMITRTGS